MGLTSAVPLTEAAAFTVGWALLRTRWFDPEQVSVVLAIIATLLIAGLLIVLTPENACLDVSTLDPQAM